MAVRREVWSAGLRPACRIGDPPSIIIASRAGLTFNDSVINLAPVVIVLMVVFIGLCQLLFQSPFTPTPSGSRPSSRSRAQ